VFRQRLPSGKPELGPTALPRGPELGLLALDLLEQAALPVAAARLGEAIVDRHLEAKLAPDHVRRLARAGKVARVHRRDTAGFDERRELSSLSAAAIVERRVDPSLDPLRREVVVRLAVPGEQDHFS
jgi:hypothetical protein